MAIVIPSVGCLGHTKRSGLGPTGWFKTSTMTRLSLERFLKDENSKVIDTIQQELTCQSGLVHVPLQRLGAV